MALELTDANFEQEIASFEGVAVVDFWALWCGPCKAISPIIEEMAEKYAGKVKVGKVDVDNNSQVSLKYSIRSIPTVLFFKNGEVVDKHVGSAPKSTYFDKVDALLS
ncbi:MAG TPA: thioredoxin [Saprospiraceae bacterium]|nr:thioredoxin [Saprospirales bacterium]HRQ30278.1 thioredoxin [Saprospiraceae bacterium]